ncbi:hypothetical protein DFH06DRAFT_1470714 [Mycena polygramma]|nr:hypothetical protein DFH06DRAFT_1470714 [Mycena polygramma]
MDAESSSRLATRTTSKKRKSDPGAGGGPAPKRPRNAKKGRLAGLLDISLDVVFEIFGHLQPLDVLRLSRTSKEFRTMLMHKSAISIWRSSLANVVPELPPCPPHMNEPQWISLVFDATCQVCQKIARKVEWRLYVRLCSKCAKSHLACRQVFPIAQDGLDLSELIPVRPDDKKPYKKVYFVEEFKKMTTVYGLFTDPEEKKKFVQRRRELKQTLSEHSKLCLAWADSIAENRSTELSDLRNDRYDAIVAKLTALGWGHEIDNMLPSDDLRSHKAVKLPNALTERTWNTLEPEMVKYMEHMKVKRLLREHAAIVLKRKNIVTKVLRRFKASQLPWTGVMPGAPDFCEFPKIKEIIEQPSEVDVDEQAFEALILDFPGMIATWREKLDEEMVKLFKKHKKSDAGGELDDDEAKARLSLVTSVFKCTSCSADADSWFFDSLFSGLRGGTVTKQCDPLFYPTVLAHRCLTKSIDLNFGSMAFLFGGASTQTAQWRTGPLTFDKITADVVNEIAVACGMDPETATVAEMDAADHRLACQVCALRPGEGGASPSTGSAVEGKGKAADRSGGEQPAVARVYSWRNAVRHHGEVHWRAKTAWFKLNDDDAATARVLEQVAIEKSKKTDRDTVRAMKDDDAMSNEAEPPTQDGDSTASGKESEVSEDVEMSADGEPSDEVRVLPLPSQLPEVVWSCAHCLDTPREPAPMTLANILQHIHERHALLSPPTLNEDYYRSLAAPEVYNKESFPGPSLTVVMPPRPVLPAPTPSPFEDMEDEYGDGGWEFGYGGRYDSDEDDDGYW